MPRSFGFEHDELLAITIYYSPRLARISDPGPELGPIVTIRVASNYGNILLDIR